MRQRGRMFERSQEYAAFESGMTSRTVCKPPTRTVFPPPGGDSGKPWRCHSKAVRSGVASAPVIRVARSSGDHTMLHPRRFQLCAVISCIVVASLPTSRSCDLVPVVEQAELAFHLCRLL